MLLFHLSLITVTHCSITYQLILLIDYSVFKILLLELLFLPLKGLIISLLLLLNFTGYLSRKELNSKLQLLPTRYYKINNHHIFLIFLNLTILLKILDLQANYFLLNRILNLLLVVDPSHMLLPIFGIHYLLNLEMLNLYLLSLHYLKLISSLLNYFSSTGLITWLMVGNVFEPFHQSLVPIRQVGVVIAIRDRGKRQRYGLRL